MINKAHLDSNILYIVLGVVLAVLINTGLGLVLSTDMPIVAVESNSMVPTFNRGDILVLQGVPTEQLQLGDIIVFSHANGNVPIVHRIIKINEDGTFQTKGDANSGQLYFEKHIEPSQIHGRSVLIVPYLGWVKIVVTDYVLPNLFWIALAALIAFIVVIGVPKAIKSRHTTYMKKIHQEP